MINSERTMPHDMDAEFGLIGWVLSDNKVLSVFGELTADDFYSAPHADIYQAIEQLSKKDMDITIFTIAPLLERPESFSDLGGVNKYLVGSYSHSLLYPQPALWAKHLINMARKRRLMEACAHGAMGDVSVEEIASSVIKAANEATTNTSRVQLKNNYEVAVEICDDFKNDVVCSPTGIKRLDQAMGGGLYVGKSYGFAARKKVGKTSLAATISYNLNMAGSKHLFICGEMSAKEIHQRVMARHTKSFTSAFRNSYGESPDFQNKIARATLDMPRNVLYSDSPGLTFDELRIIVTSAHENHKIDGFILDYWQLVGGKGKGQSTAEHLDDVAQWIADMSRKLGLWSITMAQINQEGNTRGGEGIRLAFDQLYQIHRPELANAGAWVEMMETRYTEWLNIGDEHNLLLQMNDHGQYFEEL